MAEKSRLVQLLEKQAALNEAIEAEKSNEEASKVLSGIGASVATTVAQAAVKAKVDIQVLHGKFFALSVADGKLSIEVVAKAASRKPSNGNGNGNGNDYDYKLADGRTFSRICDAIDKLTGKPCELVHDGKTYDDGKPKLRYDRLTKDMKTAITQVAKVKPAEASQPKPAEAEAEASQPKPAS